MVERHEVAWIIGGLFAAAAVVFSGLQIRSHLLYTHERFRKLVVRILIMVPLYAIEAWLGLRFKSLTMYFDLLRECYEAFVIFSFYQFLVIYLGGEDHLLNTILAHKPQQKHVFPFCCFHPWTMGGPNDSFLLYTKIGTLQYCVVKPFLGLIAFVCDASGVYGDGEIQADVAYPYIAFFANASQIWAMYCLVLFYMATKPELAPCRPIPKFLCVKATVFFTWWQGVLLAVLAKVGVLGATETYTEENVVMGLQDFILCIEMLLAAIAHHYAFNYRDFSELAGGAAGADGTPTVISPTPGVVRSMFEAVNVSDVFLKDVRQVHAAVQKKRKHKKDQNRLLAADYTEESRLNAGLSAGAMLGGNGKMSIDMTALRRDVSVSESTLTDGVGDEGDDDASTSPLTTPHSTTALITTPTNGAAPRVVVVAGGGAAGAAAGIERPDSPPYTNALPSEPLPASTGAGGVTTVVAVHSSSLVAALAATTSTPPLVPSVPPAGGPPPVSMVGVGTPPEVDGAGVPVATPSAEKQGLLRGRNSSDSDRHYPPPL